LSEVPEAPAQHKASQHEEKLKDQTASSTAQLRTAMQDAGKARFSI
jgi:hypothetical protein